MLYRVLGLIRLLLFSRQVISNCSQPHGLQYARLPCLSPSPRISPSSCSLNQWCNPTISSSAILFSSAFNLFPVSGSFPLSPLFTSGGQSIGALAENHAFPDQFFYRRTWSQVVLASDVLSSLESTLLFSSPSLLGMFQGPSVPQLLAHCSSVFQWQWWSEAWEISLNPGSHTSLRRLHNTCCSHKACVFHFKAITQHIYDKIVVNSWAALSLSPYIFIYFDTYMFVYR